MGGQGLSFPTSDFLQYASDAFYSRDEGRRCRYVECFGGGGGGEWCGRGGVVDRAFGDRCVWEEVSGRAGGSRRRGEAYCPVGGAASVSACALAGVAASRVGVAELLGRL